MQLYIALRGEVNAVDRFLKELSSQYLPFQIQDQKTQTGELLNTMLQVGVRVLPLGIYEIAFPARWLDMMLFSLCGDSKGEHAIFPRSINSKLQKWAIGMFRKLLGCKAPPKTWATDKFLPFFHDGVEIVIIGLREDKWIKDGKEVSKDTPGCWEAF